MEDKRSKRSIAREQAFILIFEKSFNADTTINELVDFARETELFDADPFAVKSATLTLEHQNEIDEIITPKLRGWTLSRISKVSLAVLRLAVCEMKFMDDIPVGVTINEAVNLAKAYGSDRDPKFVNGLLSAIKNAKPDEQQEDA